MDEGVNASAWTAGFPWLTGVGLSGGAGKIVVRIRLTRLHPLPVELDLEFADVMCEIESIRGTQCARPIQREPGPVFGLIPYFGHVLLSLSLSAPAGQPSAPV